MSETKNGKVRGIDRVTMVFLGLFLVLVLLLMVAPYLGAILLVVLFAAGILYATVHSFRCKVRDGLGCADPGTKAKDS